MLFSCIATSSALNNTKEPIYVKDIESHGGKIHSVFEKEFVLELHDGVVVNEGGVLTGDGYILQDTQTFGHDQQKLMRKNRDINEENPTYFHGKLAIISSPGSENWYHWLLQVLPRLIILKESKLSYDSIYINKMKLPWQNESLKIVLDYLNIDVDKMLPIDGDSIIQADILLVPSVPFIPAKKIELPNWLKTELKSIFVKDDNSQYQNYDKIYISRAKASSRRILNEKDFLAKLEMNGFKILFAEELSVYNQATIFNNAKIIITPHGSGLANLVFIKPDNTKVIEVDHNRDRGDLYENICKMMLCSSYKKIYADTLTQNSSSEDMVINDIAQLMGEVE